MEEGLVDIKDLGAFNIFTLTFPADGKMQFLAIHPDIISRGKKEAISWNLLFMNEEIFPRSNSSRLPYTSNWPERYHMPAVKPMS